MTRTHRGRRALDLSLPARSGWTLAAIVLASGQLAADTTGCRAQSSDVVRQARIWTGYWAFYAAAGDTFGSVLNVEVVEHFEHLPAFLADCARLVRPGGVMVVATINRTPLAWLMAIIGAERIMGWLPQGTHHYRKLVKPEELVHGLGEQLVPLDRTGVRVNPFNRAFSFSDSMAVNYMMLFRRTAEAGDR